LLLQLWEWGLLLGSFCSSYERGDALRPGLGSP
jgi:hypothetical protein